MHKLARTSPVFTVLLTLSLVAGACSTRDAGRAASEVVDGGPAAQSDVTTASPDAPAPSADTPASAPAAVESSATGGTPPAAATPETPAGQAPKSQAAPSAQGQSKGPQAPTAAGGPRPATVGNQAAVTPGVPTPAPGAGSNPADVATKAVVSKGQGFTDTTIKIGASMPMSGLTASFGQEALGAINAYIKLTNERGGVFGRKMEIVAYDDAFDPAQTLANVKRLWEKDKVAFIFVDIVDSPNEYVTEKNIPLFSFGGGPRGFSSKYPTVYPIASSYLAWNSQAASGVVNYIGRRPKKVGVMTDTQSLETHQLAKWITEYWKKLGAEQVHIDPFDFKDGDCTSLVLKYKQLGIEYWDWQSFAWLLCMPAMERLQWRPPLGMGGPVASMAPISNQAGESMVGVTSGHPGDLSDGRPRFNGPQAAHKEYMDALRRFEPKLANPVDADSPGTQAMYTAAVYAIKGALMGAGQHFGELSKEAMIRWVQEHGDNFDTGIGTPVKGFKAGCKSGNDKTWWGLWKWDDAKQTLYKDPSSPMVDSTFWTKDPCYLTKVADELVLGKKWQRPPGGGTVANSVRKYPVRWLGGPNWSLL